MKQQRNILSVTINLKKTHQQYYYWYKYTARGCHWGHNHRNTWLGESQCL